jgi:ribosomal protein S18 acetylase RimI-like enzyme
MSHEITSQTIVDSAALDLARRLEQSISLGPTPPEVEDFTCGPFRVVLANYTADPSRNYALPITSLAATEVTEDTVRALCQAFTTRGRLPRVEFVAELWPTLPPLLEAAGLLVEEREPLMACPAERFAPLMAPGVAVRALTGDDPDETLATYISIHEDTPEGEHFQPPADAIARLRRQIEGGRGWHALATLDGQPAGTGRCEIVGDDLGEVGGIVTNPQLRRRGVAATVTSFVVGQYFAQGGTLAWLSAANETARRVYARLGFQAIGTLLAYQTPA